MSAKIQVEDDDDNQRNSECVALEDEGGKAQAWDDKPMPVKESKSMRSVKSIRSTLFGQSYDDIKKKVRESVKREEEIGEYDVTNFYWETGLCQKIARHHYFDNCTLFVISFNAVWMSIATDWEKAEEFTASQPLYQAMEHLFCAYFFWEWLMRFGAFRNKCDGRKDAWFVFDTCLVFMMVLETWVMYAITELAGGDGLPFNASVLRLVRLLRLSRLVRMLKSLPELMILIKGMMRAMQSVMYVGALMTLFTYVFAILCVQLGGAPPQEPFYDPATGIVMQGGDIMDPVTDPNNAYDKIKAQYEADLALAQYFANVPTAMYSLLIFCGFADDLSAFMDDVRNSSWWCLIPFLFIYIGGVFMTIMNMLIGVLCEVVAQVSDEEKETTKVENTELVMEKVMRNLDKDKNDILTYKEFECILQDDQAMAALRKVEVDTLGICDFAQMFFFDDDDNPYDLKFPDFMKMILELRDSNKASVKDVKSVYQKIKRRMARNYTEIADVKTKIAEVRKQTTDKADAIIKQLQECEEILRIS